MAEFDITLVSPETHLIVSPSSSDIERFLKYISIDVATGCHNWVGTMDHDAGYGDFWFNGRNIRAHRFAYAWLVGPIPHGKTIRQLDHLCRNRRCVNVDHLELVTPRENSLRGDTFAARNLAKTHCVNGHLFSEENTYRHGRFRYCRTCKRETAHRPARAAKTKARKQQYESRPEVKERRAYLRRLRKMLKRAA